MPDYDELERLKRAALPIGAPTPAAPKPPVEVSDLEFEALGDVVVAMPVLRKTSKGGIELPPDQQRTPFHIAVSVGDQVARVKVGDQILATGGANFDTDSGRMFFFREKDILSIVRQALPAKDAEPTGAYPEPGEGGEEPSLQ